MRYTYAYVGAEPFDADLHHEKHAFTSGGRRLVNILYTLVQKGTSVKMGEVVEKKGLIPVRDEQEFIDFEIFRFDGIVADVRTDTRARRTIPVALASDAMGSPFVLKKDRVAMLSVEIGGMGRPRTERVVDLELHFSETEVRACAKSRVTGAATIAIFKYDS